MDAVNFLLLFPLLLLAAGFMLLLNPFGWVG